MAKLYKIKKDGDSPDYLFMCPGCECGHGIWTTESNGNKAIWQFNGDMDKPTITPSVKVQHHYNDKDIICHSFITNGFIEFLPDCTHELAGKTVELENVI